MSGHNYLEMSDEDFLAMQDKGEGLADPAPEPTPAPEEVETPVVEEPVPEVQPEPTPVEPEKQVEEPVPEETDAEVLAKLKAKEEPKKTEPTPDPVAGAEPKPVEGIDPEKKEEPTPETPPDYEALYKTLMAPIKANGKTLEIKSPEEATRLMQMGAGFHRKMTEIQPHLKTLRFMEQNNLLNVDQAELAFLVDLRNKNPDAIKKLVKDSGIDPLDLSSEEPVDYRSSIPQVTDQQVVFSDALNSVKEQDGGTETLAVMNKWDAKSHQALLNNPELVSVIHEQRAVGIYDRIVAEVDRQTALGNIPVGTPFIAAYKQVGDHLQSTNGFADLIEKQNAPVPVAQPAPKVIDTRVSAPTPSVTNNDKVKAAASPKAAPRKVAPFVNPLAMSDEEFQKQYGNRF